MVKPKVVWPDWTAISDGALRGLPLLGAAGLIGALTNAVDDDRTLIVLPLLLLGLVGLGVAGWFAARRTRRGAPLVHGAAAAATAVCFFGALVAVSRDTYNWEAAGVWLLLAVAAGIVGGLAALRPPREAESRSAASRD